MPLAPPGYPAPGPKGHGSHGGGAFAGGGGNLRRSRLLDPDAAKGEWLSMAGVCGVPGGGKPPAAARVNFADGALRKDARSDRRPGASGRPSVHAAIHRSVSLGASGLFRTAAAAHQPAPLHRVVAPPPIQAPIRHAQANPSVGTKPAVETHARPAGAVGGVDVAAGDRTQPHPPAPPPAAPAPLTAAAAAAAHAAVLSAQEAVEIKDYAAVWYCGCPAKVKAPTANGINHGYDDDRGDYKVVTNDHIAFRYEILEMLGKGSFGQVVRCLDHKTGAHVAVKIIRNKRRFHNQALIEIKLLQHLRANDKEQANNVVVLHEYCTFRNHICMIFELHSINLYEFMKMNNFQQLGMSLVRKFSVQLLKSLAYLNREKIVHCDLKPENILLKQANKSSIKLIDFGSSCFEHERLYTYMQSRYYRAPEVILGVPYGTPIDMWSFGCTMAEVAMGRPLFPGEDENEQLACIMEVLNRPPSKLVQRSPRKRHFFDSAGQLRSTQNSRGKSRKAGDKSLKEVLRTGDLLFVDFIRCCLEWLPERRMTADQALQHPWITGGQPMPKSIIEPTPPPTAVPPQRSRQLESYLPSINERDRQP
ncbi:Dual specificity tyrosine-phosphorylation-regulated kinase 2 [Diplonema papillatum]|nr:Dual specificity tyrosine-phosphorylation-regulated kinase 2 [Diplonema papillatum]